MVKSKQHSSHLNCKVFVCQLLQQNSFRCWTKIKFQFQIFEKNHNFGLESLRIWKIQSS